MSEHSVFARLRLSGGRFDGPGMPVETLVELTHYHELLLSVARAQFLHEHPERQRVPRGFFDRLRLTLRTVEDGSAVPVLERQSEDASLPLVAFKDDEFTRARDAIQEVVAAAAGGQPIPSALPADAFLLFNRFGRTLRPDEAIELRGGSAASGPRYTVAARRALLLDKGHTYQEDVQDIGWISEVNADEMSCLVRLRMGPSAPVPAPLDEVSFGPVKHVLAPKGEGPPVRIFGVGVFDATRLIRFDSIQDVSVLEDPDELVRLDSRLDEIAALKPGWLDGEGARPDARALERARRTLAELLAYEVPRPRVFATPEGGVQAEWTVKDHEVSVSFEPDDSLYAVSVNVCSGAADEPELSADDPAQIAELLRAS